MPRVDPPKEHRFSSEHQPTRKGPVKGAKYFKPLLKKLLNGTIEYDDPILKKKIEGKLGRIIALRHIMNAIQGEHPSIKDIMDRVDDENVPSSESNTSTKIIIIRDYGNKAEEVSRSVCVQPQEISSNVVVVGDGQESLPNPTRNVVLRADTE